MEKSHKKSGYTVSLGDSKKSNHFYKDCGSSSDDDDVVQGNNTDFIL